MPLFSTRSKRTPIIGLDIGSYAIKATQFGVQNRELKLVGYGMLNLPEGVIVSGNIVKPDYVKEALSNLFSFYSFTGNRIATNVSGNVVITRELSIENISENELDDAVKWEAVSFLPAKAEGDTPSSRINDFSFDYQVLNEIERDNGKKDYHVLFAAAPLHVVNTIDKLLKDLKFDVVSIEVEAFAMARLLYFLNPDTFASPDMIFVPVNIGHSKTAIDIVDTGIVRFSRIIDTGGAYLIDNISKSLGIDKKDAENKMLTIDMVNSNLDIFNMVEDDIKNIALEIKRSILFYFTQYNGGKNKPVLVLLNGGCANIKNIDKFMQDVSGYRVMVNRFFSDIANYDPVLFTKEYLVETAPIYSVSVGLALREYR